MHLSKEQTDICKQYILKAIYDESVPLPETLEANKLYKISFNKYESWGRIDLRFKIHVKANKKISIDYYFKTDAYSSHKRIDNLGNIIDLENFEGQFGWPVFENKEKTEKEHARIRIHNQSIYEILKEKGFED